MSTLSGSSTLADVQAEYDDNAGYAEDASAAKAAAFVTAARILLRRLPAESGTREAHVRINLEIIQGELARAERWLQANDASASGGGNGRVTRFSFRNSRS